MKLGQVMNITRQTSFFKNYVEIEAGRLVPHLFLFKKMLNMREKQMVCSLVSIYFDSPQLAIQ